MDLSAYSVNEDSVFMQLKHPATGENLLDDNKPVGLKVVSVFSKEYKDVDHRIMKRRMKDGITSKGGRVAIDADPAELEKDGLERLAACIVGYENVKLNGKEPENTIEFEVILYKSGEVDLFKVLGRIRDESGNLLDEVYVSLENETLTFEGFTDDGVIEFTDVPS
jgi:hypothetical protein